ncbi:hypothetical protein HXA31_12855 [Salipaludibacillus agaradhaerens]|jgi:hypothetical protein|uniref:Uncharacterized protein n=1 Tax=Salipaludibacillus agaradhaerens TaxID=76935 RepID=A0A9Q4FX74_SALAG|nr:hypothetical protein [Salipaludibacillus agaradhaerens]MCR6095191.1 hypothetical protein [Salipaludibacillus agaradhaerens]MCR6115251.1 hypothetical protein [Salipaludibacillus agaradhaerens]
MDIIVFGCVILGSLLAVNAFGYFGFLRGKQGVSKTFWIWLSLIETAVILIISYFFRVI